MYWSSSHRGNDRWAATVCDVMEHKCFPRLACCYGFGLHTRHTLQGGVPDLLTPQNVRNLRPTSFQRSPAWPIGQQWNLNIQRQLAKDLVMEVGSREREYAPAVPVDCVSGDEHRIELADTNGPARLLRKFALPFFPGTAGAALCLGYQSAGGLYVGAQHRRHGRFLEVGQCSRRQRTAESAESQPGARQRRSGRPAPLRGRPVSTNCRLDPGAGSARAGKGF